MSTSFSNSYCSSTKRVRASANGLQLLRNRQSVRSALHGARLQQFFQTGHADLEELIEVCARDAQKLHSLEQRNAMVLGLIQDPLIELQKREFAVDVELRCLQVGVVHAKRCTRMLRGQ